MSDPARHSDVTRLVFGVHAGRSNSRAHADNQHPARRRRAVENQA